MFLRATIRKKDGKEHTYCSVVENKRVADGRVVQRHLLYLSEINSSQELAGLCGGILALGSPASPCSDALLRSPNDFRRMAGLRIKTLRYHAFVCRARSESF